MHHGRSKFYSVLTWTYYIIPGLDLIVNAIAKEILRKQPKDGDINSLIASYLRNQVTIAKTSGVSILDVPAQAE